MGKPDKDDLVEDMEASKYFLWLDETRSKAFFADYVLLVEGTSDRVLIEMLIGDGLECAPECISIVDTMGKWNTHRFMNLLSTLGIDHGVLYDFDGGGKKNEGIAKLIEDSGTEYTKVIDRFETNLEDFLGLEKKKSWKKAPHLVLKYRNGDIDQSKLNLLCEKLKEILPQSS